MVLGDVEETILVVDIDEESMEQSVRVGLTLSWEVRSDGEFSLSYWALSFGCFKRRSRRSMTCSL